MDAARLLERLDHQGLTLFAQGARLIVRPGNLLTANDETLIREHKPELLRLARLRDAETVYRALVEAGPAGLAWREGTPPDWPDERLLAVGEVLYAYGRMVNVLGIRVVDAGSQITSGGGSVTLTGIEGGGNATNRFAVNVLSSGAVSTATNGGNLT